MRGHEKPATEEEMEKIRDINFGRLKLMLIMAKAYLMGYPLDEHRKQAIIENARQLDKNWRSKVQFGYKPACTESSEDEHLFDQRVKLLTVMVRAAAHGYPLGQYRRIALINSIDIISKRLMFDGDAGILTFLKAV